jgi:hypothetical protein
MPGHDGLRRRRRRRKPTGLSLLITKGHYPNVYASGQSRVQRFLPFHL